MDRVAQLAADADDCIEFEKCRGAFGLSSKAARHATRKTLEAIAASLGFPENEISAAIDTALAGR